MKAHEIIKKTEEFCPKSLAYEWDNPGLQIGNPEKEIKSVYLTLDVTSDTVEEALKNGCEMIISHHPLFFNNIKKIDFSTFEGKLIQTLITNDIVVFSAHTNMDRADFGINYVLAKKLELKNIRSLNDDNLGKIGETDSMSLLAFANIVSKSLDTHVAVWGYPKKVIKKVAVCSGAGADTLDDALLKDADVLVTGDVKYHTALSAKETGLSLIDAGHFGTETFVMDIFEEILKKTNLKFIKSTVKHEAFIINA